MDYPHPAGPHRSSSLVTVPRSTAGARALCGANAVLVFHVTYVPLSSQQVADQLGSLSAVQWWAERLGVGQ